MGNKGGPVALSLRNGDGPPPLPSLPFRSQVVSPKPRPSVSFPVALCSFLFVPVLTTDGNRKANGRNGQRPEGRTDGNGKDGTKPERGKRGTACLPFLLPSFPAFLPSFLFAHTYARNKAQFRFRSSLIFCRSSRFYFRSSKTGFPFQFFISHLQKQKQKKTYENTTKNCGQVRPSNCAHYLQISRHTIKAQRV